MTKEEDCNESQSHRVHALAERMPVHYVVAIDLGGAETSLKLHEILETVGMADKTGIKAGIVSRFALMRVMSWLLMSPLHGSRALARDLYLSDEECVSELESKELHALIVLASERVAAGQRLTLAAHARPRTWIGSLALPMLNLLFRRAVGPAIARDIRKLWQRRLDRKAADRVVRPAATPARPVIEYLGLKYDPMRWR